MRVSNKCSYLLFKWNLLDFIFDCCPESCPATYGTPRYK